MQKSTFEIKRMDCSAEEQLVRMKLEGFEQINSLSFDLGERKLKVYHTADVEPIARAIAELGLNDRLLSTEQSQAPEDADDENQQRKLLIWVLVINALFFVVEMTAGLIAHSMGLVADSLDMLADALVYGLSLYAVGSTILRKKKIAKISGYFQFILAIAGFIEVIRRSLGLGETPEYGPMIIISLLALAGNAASLVILKRAKSNEAHIRASQIFTSNDVIINIGVMLAGGLVYMTSSRIPDLIIGSIVFAIVVRGAFSIMKLAK